MTYIPDSELVINKNNSIYHLNLQKHQIADTIITVGDPGRVERISRHFDKINFKVQKREFVTHTGTLNGKALTVISTGIGTDNTEIVLLELDALANIDFPTRKINENFRQLTFIRIGTCGSLQEDIPVESIVLSSMGLGLDGLLQFYKFENNPEEKRILSVLENYTKKKGLVLPIKPYLFEGDNNLKKLIGEDIISGITATCGGFYAPQGRQLRIDVAEKQLLPILQGFQFEKYRITNFEMETAGIFGLSRLLGHRAASLNVVLANRATNAFTDNPYSAVEKLIKMALERIVEL